MNVFEIECESAREIKLKPFAIKERKGHEMLFMWEKKLDVALNKQALIMSKKE